MITKRDYLKEQVLLALNAFSTTESLPIKVQALKKLSLLGLTKEQISMALISIRVNKNNNCQ
jgi:hypothetical protein